MQKKITMDGRKEISNKLFYLHFNLILRTIENNTQLDFFVAFSVFSFIKNKKGLSELYLVL